MTCTAVVIQIKHYTYCMNCLLCYISTLNFRSRLIWQTTAKHCIQIVEKVWYNSWVFQMRQSHNTVIWIGIMPSFKPNCVYLGTSFLWTLLWTFKWSVNIIFSLLGSNNYIWWLLNNCAMNSCNYCMHDDMTKCDQQPENFKSVASVLEKKKKKVLSRQHL